MNNKKILRGINRHGRFNSSDVVEFRNSDSRQRCQVGGSVALIGEEMSEASASLKPVGDHTKVRPR